MENLRTWHLTIPATIFPIASLMAAAIWLTRRFGWAVFLSAVLAGGIVFAVWSLLVGSGQVSFSHGEIPLLGKLSIMPSQNALSTEIEAVFIMALCTFFAFFVLGLFVNLPRMRKHVIVIGYTGVLFSSAFLFPILVGLKLENAIGASLICIAATILLLSMIEFGMRKSMHGHLYNPQP